ncbi:hypothetical protein Tco_1397105 [Tanacetum coccineum]
MLNADSDVKVKIDIANTYALPTYDGNIKIGLEEGFSSIWKVETQYGEVDDYIEVDICFSVTSELAFSTSAIDKFRSSLTPNTAKAFICEQHWLWSTKADLHEVPINRLQLEVMVEVLEKLTISSIAFAFVLHPLYNHEEEKFQNEISREYSVLEKPVMSVAKHGWFVPGALPAIPSPRSKCSSEHAS